MRGLKSHFCGGNPEGTISCTPHGVHFVKGESLFNKKYFSQCEKYFFYSKSSIINDFRQFYFYLLIFAKAIAIARIRKKIIVNYNSLEQILTIAVLIIILKKSPKWMTY